MEAASVHGATTWTNSDAMRLNSKLQELMGSV